MLFILIYLLFFTYQALADIKPIAEGNELPEITLSVPKNPEHLKYLGLTGKGSVCEDKKGIIRYAHVSDINKTRFRTSCNGAGEAGK